MKKNANQSQSGSIANVLQDLAWTLDLVWRAHPGYTFTIVVLTFLQGVIPAIQLWIWKLFVDAAAKVLQANGSAAELFWQLASFLIFQAGLYLSGLLVNALHDTLQHLVGELLQNQIRIQILEKANSLQVEFFENANFYDKLQNAHQESSYRPLQIVIQIFSLVRIIITLSSIITIIFWLNWIILPIILISLLPVLRIQNRYGQANFWMLRARTPELRRQQYIGTILTSDWMIKEIRAFQAEVYLINLFRSMFTKFFSETRTLVIKQNTAAFSGSLISLLGLLIGNGYVVYQIARHSITIGDFALYIQVIAQTQTQLYSLLEGLSALYTNLLFIHNLFEFLEQPAQKRQTGIVWNEPVQKIEFRNVSFYYPGTNNLVLEDISFSVQKGELLALVGKNGVGKTTLIKLFCRLYEPSSGQILINDKDISQYSSPSIQEHITVLFQDYGHYYFSAQQNIGLGRVTKMNDMDAIKTSAHFSGAHTIIDGLPEKYDTILGRWFECGQNLSIGEWQKVALARTFLRGGSIAILDEPTSSLDAESEWTIFDILGQRRKDLITIVVSHRLSTGRLADRILMLDQHHIIEDGSHGDLMKKNGKYASLFRLQAQGFQVS